ncbi:MAG: hypothetical protein ACJ8FM_14415 [Xanthobacteraceae bacterium]
MSRNFKFAALMAILVIAVVELQAWVFVRLAMWSGSLRFYPSDIFVRTTDEQLARAAGRGLLGWPSNEGPRAGPSEQKPVCGSAFGDSMTYGAEVEDDEAWVHLLSVRLGCTVANYAVPAYGLDQAVLRYEHSATEGKFVIVGVFLEMIRRSVAASWTFYAPVQPMAVYQIKPYFSLDGESLRLHAIPEPATRQAIAAHHVGDYYMRDVATVAKFPYALTAARGIYLRLVKTDDYRRHTEKYLDPAHPSGSGILARRLLDRFAHTAQRRNARLAVVLVPSIGRLLVDDVWTDQFARDLTGRAETCVIDLKPILRDYARSLAGKIPTAPKGHYTAQANRWMADGVAAGLGGCGITP